MGTIQAVATACGPGTLAEGAADAGRGAGFGGVKASGLSCSTAPGFLGFLQSEAEEEPGLPSSGFIVLEVDPGNMRLGLKRRGGGRYGFEQPYGQLPGL